MENEQAAREEYLENQYQAWLEHVATEKEEEEYWELEMERFQERESGED